MEASQKYHHIGLLSWFSASSKSDSCNGQACVQNLGYVHVNPRVNSIFLSIEIHRVKSQGRHAIIMSKHGQARDPRGLLPDNKHEGLFLTTLSPERMTYWTESRRTAIWRVVNRLDGRQPIRTCAQLLTQICTETGFRRKTIVFETHSFSTRGGDWSRTSLFFHSSHAFETTTTTRPWELIVIPCFELWWH